jgi:hypothetical protein
MKTFFSSNMANGVLKISLFILISKTLIVVKVHPNKVLTKKTPQKRFFMLNFFWVHFLIRSNIHLKSVRKDGFLIPQPTCSKKKSFHPTEESMCTFYVLVKSPKFKQPLNILWRVFKKSLVLCLLYMHYSGVSNNQSSTLYCKIFPIALGKNFKTSLCMPSMRKTASSVSKYFCSCTM